MRPSERVAAAAVALMVAPAFLALPALCIWGVMHVWPRLTTAQHVCFWLSLALLACSLPYVVRRHLDAVWRGSTRRPSTFEEVLILGPLAIGAWSLTGNWAAALVPFGIKVLSWLMGRADVTTGRTGFVTARRPTGPEDVEISPLSKLVRGVKARRSVRQTITMGPRRAKSRRDRGR